VSETLLEVEGLRLGYGRNDVVHGVSLAVARGTIVSLIGANGAGKTTLLKGISGLVRPRGGKIRFQGRDLARAPAHVVARAGVVQVPEGRQVFADMTVEENLAMGAYRVGRPTRAATEAVLARFPRLAERLTQRAGLMSGGEQQMLAIGRALMAQPELILMDEPSMGLAPLIVEEIFSVIRGLREEGRTILLVEQNAASALAISDRAYVLESGRVVIEGEGGTVARDPRVVAAYLGA
jgi:branched-chain amino acid transport system ATP-binding protein